MKNIILITTLIILSWISSNSKASEGRTEFAKEFATEMLVSVLGSLAEGQLNSLFGDNNKVTQKPLTKKQITEALEEALSKAKVREIKTNLEILRSLAESYVFVTIPGDQEVGTTSKTRQLEELQRLAIGIFHNVNSNISNENFFELLPIQEMALNQWILFAIERGIVLDNGQSAVSDIATKASMALGRFHLQYTHDFRESGIRKCIHKNNGDGNTTKQWWGNMMGDTIKKQYIGKKGKYSRDISTKFCIADRDHAKKQSKSYAKKKHYNELLPAGHSKERKTIHPIEEAYKDYSWPTDIPNPLLMSPEMNMVPLNYSHRNKLRYWFLVPHQKNEPNTAGSYKLMGPYKKKTDAASARIKDAVRYYHQSPVDNDPWGLGFDVARTMACWGKIVLEYGESDQKSRTLEILKEMDISASECKTSKL